MLTIYALILVCAFLGIFVIFLSFFQYPYIFQERFFSLDRFVRLFETFGIIFLIV